MINVRSIPYMQIRGGSSKGLYFLASDLPLDADERDQILLSAMGRDVRQIDGLGGADPLTSKVAIVGPSSRPNADVDFLFVQVVVGENRVDTTPNCGNILAGVGAFALEAGLLTALPTCTAITVNMLNSDKLCELIVQTPDEKVTYEGDTRIDGVPGTSAPVVCNYLELAGSVCGALFPSNNFTDTVLGTQVTCIDNGMPLVLMRASDFGLSGRESPAELNANDELIQRLEALRLTLGPIMNLGDVKAKSVPKMCLISAPTHGGLINTRTFIPHVCHAAVGVLGAVSVATACLFKDTVASAIVDVPEGDLVSLRVEHPCGEFSVQLHLDRSQNSLLVRKAGVVRTARLLSRGTLYI